jgi:hypothetical protein
MAVMFAAFVAVVFVTGSGAQAVDSGSCNSPCSGGSQTIVQTGGPTPTPCIRDVGCGGGGALATSVGIAAVVVMAAGAAALGLGVWRRRRAVSVPLVGRLLADGLFRPPRVLFDA